ncbi:hypothetical protein EDB19DRAFT_1837629 [Suillus lakei]|nr:hypothetical protein EDB19DRAFT_1837629 [Suillus lakei]
MNQDNSSIKCEWHGHCMQMLPHPCFMVEQFLWAIYLVQSRQGAASMYWQAQYDISGDKATTSMNVSLSLRSSGTASHWKSSSTAPMVSSAPVAVPSTVLDLLRLQQHLGSWEFLAGGIVDGGEGLRR